MNFKKLTYFLLTGSLLAGVTACTDDYFDRYGGSTANSNVVTYSPTVGRSAGDGSRAGEPEYQPLILTGDRPSDSLYLHTFAVNKIGFRPGESTTGLDSRGYQVNDIDNLIEYNKDCKVHAEFAEESRKGDVYINWSDAKSINNEKTIWNTATTNFWPSQEQLAFHAVSPRTEFSSLEKLTWENNSMEFDYTAKKSSDGNTDAEVQPDLLVAASQCNKAEANSSFSGHAPLKFHHALSAIKFAIRDVANGTIKNIQIKGVYGAGHCTYTANADGTNGTFAWSDHSGKETYSQDFNFKFDQGDNSPITPGDASHDIEMWASMPSKTFMLIPQQIPVDAEIIITLERDRGAGPETVILHGNIVKNSVEEWKPGYEYIYTISTSNDNWVYVLEACGNHVFTPDYNANDGGDGLTTLDKSDSKHYNDFSESPTWHNDAGLIFVYAPRNPDFDKYEEHGHFHVRSFRYRVNKPSVIEDLPWKAHYQGYFDKEDTGKDIRQYENNDGKLGFPGNYVEGRDLPYNDWISDKSVLSGTGSHTEAGEEKRFEFAAHHLTSSWQGDKDMQTMPAYTGNSESSPWDLSRMEQAKDGNLPQNTANTYVIDRQGWYILPCVYGNAITGGSENPTAYKRTLGDNSDIIRGGYTYKYLSVFHDHLGNPISTSWIPEKTNYITNSSEAVIAWGDVYNAVSDISIITFNSHKYIKFKANQYNLMQGNVVIALLDNDYDKGGKVIWSWQIWVNEHWLDSDRTNDADGKSHAFASAHESDFSTYHASPTGRRDRGDLQVAIPGATSYKYWMAPVNLGWCDPKSQYYLRRQGFMNYEQYRPDGKTKTGKTARLHIFQNGLFFDYKFGNNTYYQFGRKEPMVGYENHTNTEKRNFGKYPYGNASTNQGRKLYEAIQHPNYFFGIGQQDDATSKINDDWCNQNWINLWNNTSHKATAKQTTPNDFTCNAIKTVYDPCPPGYMIPPAAVLRIIQTGGYDVTDNISLSDFLSRFNGKYLGENITDENNELYYAYNVNAKGSGASGIDNTNKITLTSTGQRWYSDYHSPTIKGISYKTGYNFNSFCVYLWSSTPMLDGKAAYSLALGRDSGREDKTKPEWVLCTYFIARRSLARPVRPVREYYDKPAGVAK